MPGIDGLEVHAEFQSVVKCLLIGIQSHGTAVLMEITVEGFHLGPGCLCGRETQRQQFTGGIIDEDDQRTARAPILEPVMG